MFFFENSCGFAVTREDHQIIIKGIQFCADRVFDLLIIAAGKVGAANATAEERIASEDAVRLAHKTDTTGRVAGCMEDFESESAEEIRSPSLSKISGFLLTSGDCRSYVVAASSSV